MCSSPKIPAPPPPPPPPQEAKSADMNELRKAKYNRGSPTGGSGSSIAGGTLLTGAGGAMSQTRSAGSLLGG